jgi:hypothetical protein
MGKLAEGKKVSWMEEGMALGSLIAGQDQTGGTQSRWIPTTP